MFYKKAVLKNFAIFTEKLLCWICFFNENRAVNLVTLLRKRLQRRSFPVNITKVLGTAVLTQPAITCSKLTIETLEQAVKYVQSKQ